MFEQIKNKILEYVDYPEEQITEQTEFLKDMKMNSFDIISMVGELEDEFNISVSTEKMNKIVTIGELAEYLKTLV